MIDMQVGRPQSLLPSQSAATAPAIFLALAAMLWQMEGCKVNSAEAWSWVKGVQGSAKHAEQTRCPCCARLLASPALASLLQDA